MTNKDKPFDIIVYGASSFVGQILVEYLAGLSASNPLEKFSWAIAGRNKEKLQSLKTQLQLPQIEHFIADANDEKALIDLCTKAKVIITTVGPYALYGETMLKACVDTGTDYCDLCGEPQWLKAMIDKYHNQAVKTGARIINTAGFDSIPSDIGVYYAQKLAIEKTNRPAKQIQMRVRKLKGAASGGTIASILNMFEEMKNKPELRKLLVNPYVLCPPGHSFRIRQKKHQKAEFDERLSIWTMPFVMAAINERIVHRTNALLNNKYGISFQYDEAMSAKKGYQAWMFTIGLGSFILAVSVSPLRKLLAKFVLPKPGEGPSPEEQRNGMFDMRFYTDLDDGNQLVVKVEGDLDPGYGSTAKMLSQAALCLVKDVPDLAGGFWTPTAALNEHLIDRLSKYAGVSVVRL